MSAVEYVDRAPPGDWHVVDVMRQGDPDRPFRSGRPRNVWVGLLIDIDPDEMKKCDCPPPLFRYVHPNEYRPGDRTVRQCWLLIPGKHKSRDAAYDALEAMMATRH